MKLLALLLTSVAAYKRQVFLVYEATGQGLLDADWHRTRQQTLDLIENLLEDENTEVGFASFVDKPNVCVGVGHYGGYPDIFHTDWCFSMVSEFTQNFDEIRDAVVRASDGAGMDEFGAHFEAITRAAISGEVKWSTDDQDDKVIVMIADSFGHSEDFYSLFDEVLAFNTPVRCVNNSTYGGFRSLHPDLERPWYAWALYTRPEEFKELQDITRLHACELSTLPPALNDRLNELDALFLPRKVAYPDEYDAELMRTDPETHCAENDYPALTDVAEALQSKNIKLVVTYAGPDETNTDRSPTLVQLWESALTDAENGLGALTPALVDLVPHGWENLSQLVSDAIDSVLA